MNITTRHERIIEILTDKQYATVDEMAAILDVSKVTIRSDLTNLEQKGLLFRTHGGAMIPENKAILRSVSRTLSEYETEKKQIAREASKFVKDGDTVIVDSGSTTVHLVEYLRHKHITLITNSLLVAQAVEDDDSIELILTGGSLRRNTKGFIGPIATNALSIIHADILFMGASGFTNETINCSNMIEAEAKRAMMKASDCVCFLSDSSKYGKKSFASIANWSDIDIFVTDSIAPGLKDELEHNGVNIVVAK